MNISFHSYQDYYRMTVWEFPENGAQPFVVKVAPYNEIDFGELKRNQVVIDRSGNKIAR